MAQLLDDCSSLVAGVEVTNLRGDLRASDPSLLEVLTSGLKDRLRPHGSGSPMKPFLEVLVEKNDDQDGPTERTFARASSESHALRKCSS